MKISSKTDVIKMKVKLRKTYAITADVLENDDFIQTLKESLEKLEKKSLKCPLNTMKNVRNQLRKNSPDVSIIINFVNFP